MWVFDRLRSFQDWRVRTRFLALVVPLVVLLTGLAVLGVYLRDTSNLQTKVIQRAHSISAQIMSERQYYTAVIVPRVVALGGSLGDDYAAVTGRFPLPATLVREVSELTANANDGFTSNLISPWPINKAKGLTDQFQKDAFAYLQDHPQGQFFRTDQIAGQAVLRFITADRATVRSCADCHNADPRSPKHDFHMDDLMGGLEIMIPIEHYVKQVRQDLAVTVVGFTGLSLVMIGIIAVGARQAFVRPLNKLTARVEQFLGGQEGAPRAELTGTRNEIQRLDQHCRRMQGLIAKQQTQLQLAATQQEAKVRARTKAILEAEDQIGSAVDHASNGVILIDRDGVIEWINQKGSHLLGRPAEEVTGQSFLTYLSPQSAASAKARLEAVQLDQPVVSQAQFDLLRADGKTLRIAVQAVSVLEGADVVGRLLIVRPV